jgi:hypothetical protein
MPASRIIMGQFPWGPWNHRGRKCDFPVFDRGAVVRSQVPRGTEIHRGSVFRGHVASQRAAIDCVNRNRGQTTESKKAMGTGPKEPLIQSTECTCSGEIASLQVDVATRR